MAKKIVCVWIGNCASQNELYSDYLRCNYENDNEAISAFGSDAGLDYYDEDAMESWWFPNLL